jgi:hypothetical protein
MLRKDCVVSEPTMLSCQGFEPGMALILDLPSMGNVTLHITMFEIARNGYGFVVTGLLTDDTETQINATLVVKRNGKMAIIT